VARSLLTVRDVATRSKLSEKTVRRAIRRGELIAFKVRGRWRVRESDYEAWIERGRAVPVRAESITFEPLAPVRGSLSALRRIETAA